MRGRILILAAALALVALVVAFSAIFVRNATHAQSAATPTLNGDAAHPAHATHWVDTRLYFELGPCPSAAASAVRRGRAAHGAGHWPVSDAEWMQFLDSEVTPRFPNGLSVQNVYGQWKGAHDAAPECGISKLLIIDYPENVENEARINAIRAAWKRMTGEQSVLKVTIPAEVSF